MIIESKQIEKVCIDKSICPECLDKMWDRGDAWICFRCLQEVIK